MFDEFKELLSAFNARNVRYLVVGGYAVFFLDHRGLGARANKEQR
jgi:hypothetical protein